MRAVGAPLSIEDLKLGDPGPAEVKVQVRAVAICGSDLHAMDGAWGDDTPVVYGHEAAGVVESVGRGVESVSPGDHVVVSLLSACGGCRACQLGETWMCATDLGPADALTDSAGGRVARGIGVAGFAEQVLVHESQIAVIPPAFPWPEASLLACGVLTGFGAVTNTARVMPGSSVVVIGVGGVGVNCVQGAVAAGATTIVAVDPDANQRALAMKAGATHAYDPTAVDVAGAVGVETDGWGADYVLVAVGRSAVIETALALTRRGGTMVIVGMAAGGETAAFDMSEFAYSGRRVLGSRMGSADLRRDIAELVSRYTSGTLLLGELIGAIFPFESLNEAVAHARRHASRTVVEMTG